MPLASHLVPPPPEGSVLDRRMLNRTLLARQLLLQPADLPVEAAIDRLVALQAQVPRDPYLSLRARLAGFDPPLLEALLVDRRAVRLTLLRNTLHLVRTRDARRFAPAVQPVWERAFASSAFRHGVAGVDRDAVVAAGTALLEAEPRSTADLGRSLAERWPEADPEALAFLVRAHVPAVQVLPRGLWRRSAAPRVTTLAAWLATPPAVPDDADAHAGDPLEELVLRYLRAFGPATSSDIRTWSWLTGLRPVLDRLAPRLRTYRDEAGRTLLDAEDGVFADSGAAAPVFLLGEYDNLFLSHADRTRVAGDLAWGAAWVGKGALFVDGFLAGSWSAKEGARSIALRLGAAVPIDPAGRRAVEEAAASLATFLAPDLPDRSIAWES